MNKYINKLLIFFLLPYLISTTLIAQDFDNTLSSKLQNQLDQFRDEHKFVGMSTAIFSDKYGQWTGASGFSQENQNDLINSNMIFGIGSVTKTYIATLIMQLEDEGKLNISDSLFSWLPSFPNIDSTIIAFVLYLRISLSA